MKNYKVYAGAIILKKGDKKLGGVIFTFNPDEIKGKKYVIEEEDYDSKALSEILNDVFLWNIKDFQIYSKHLMGKLRINKEQKEVKENDSDNSNIV